METLSQMMLETPDLNQERLNKLKELFPDLFTVEGKLNEDELKKLTTADGAKETERYDFRWFGKSQAKRNAYTATNTTLIYDEARSVNPNESENIIVEGENLEVLKLLLCAYREKVKCIYIDPPYNTGKDFVYSDNYTEEKRPYWEKTGAVVDGVKQTTNPDTSGRFHSDWLDMMYSRLLVARSLLRNDGVIFISIDDNEIHNLRKLCDEVFDANNFLGCIVRATGTTTGQDASKFGSSFDYCLAYRKSEEMKLIGLPLTEKDKRRFNNNDNDGKGKYALLQLRKTGNADRKEDRENMFYPVIAPDGNKIYPVGHTGYLSRWRVGETKFKEFIKKKMIVWKKVDEVSASDLEDFEDDLEELVSEENGETNGATLDSEIVVNNTYIPYVKYYLEGRTKKPSNLWNDIDGNKKGSIELRDLFEVPKIFDNPKPSEFIKRIVQVSCAESDLVLDFFAGAGSTGQSVFDLVNKSKLNLNFILVQLPELTEEKSNAHKAGYKKISDITIERTKRVVEKIIAEKEAEHPNLFAENKDALKGLGFKVFQLVKSNFPRTEFKPDANKSDEENIEALKKYIEEKERQQTFGFNIEDLLTEILLKQGFMLNFKLTDRPEFTNNRVTHATDGEKETLICLDEDIKLETIEYLKTHNELKFICLERALDTTKKWNLNHYLGEKAIAF